MGMEFGSRETRALFGMLSDSADDIIIRTDEAGFVYSALHGLQRLATGVPDLLIGPHLLDLFEIRSARAVEGALAAALAGRAPLGSFDVCAADAMLDGGWYRLRLTSIADESGRSCGALAMLRSIDEQRALQERLFLAEMTDPATGLTNRSAFLAMMEHLVDCGAQGHAALIELDHFQSFRLRHGHSAADEMICAVARLMRKVARRDDIISRFGQECFGVLMPARTVKEAETLVGRIVSTLAAIGHVDDPARHSLTASAGITCFAQTLDETLNRAELAMFMARARGGNGIEAAGRTGRA